MIVTSSILTSGFQNKTTPLGQLLFCGICFCTSITTTTYPPACPSSTTGALGELGGNDIHKLNAIFTHVKIKRERANITGDWERTGRGLFGSRESLAQGNVVGEWTTDFLIIFFSFQEISYEYH